MINKTQFSLFQQLVSVSALLPTPHKSRRGGLYILVTLCAIYAIPLVASTDLNGQNQFAIYNYTAITGVPNINHIYYAMNTTDIQTQLNKCDGVTQCVVYIPSGSYAMTNMLEINSKTRLIIDGDLDWNYDTLYNATTAPVAIDDATDHDIVVEGSGMLSLNESKQTSLGGHLVRIGNTKTRGATRIKIKDLTLKVYGNGPLYQDCFIGIEHSDDVEVLGVTMIDLNQGKDYGICSSGTRYRFVNNQIYNTDNHGIGFENADNIFISGNQLFTSTDDNIGWHGINGGNTTNLIISNNIVTTNTTRSFAGIRVDSSPGALITGNTINGKFIEGIGLREHSKNALVSNNQVLNTYGDCVQAVQMGGAEHVTITANYLLNCGRNAINTSSIKIISSNNIRNASWHGIYSSSYADDAVISSNSIYNSGQDLTANYSGIYIRKNVDNLVISGNRIGDDQTPKTQAYAITCNQTDPNRAITISGNDLSGNKIRSLNGNCITTATGQTYFANSDMEGVLNYIYKQLYVIAGGIKIIAGGLTVLSGNVTLPRDSLNYNALQPLSAGSSDLNLSLYHKYNGNFVDYSQNNLVAVSAVNISYILGRFGQAIDFTSPGYINLGRTSALQVNGVVNWTYCVWIKPHELGRDQFIISQYSNAPPEASLFIDVSNRYRIVFRNLTTTNPATSITPIMLEIWQHVCGTYDANTGNTSIYVNGVLENSVIGGRGNLTSDSVFRIGNRGNLEPNNYLNAALDELRVYRRILSPSEITAEYLRTIETVPTVTNWNQLRNFPSSCPSGTYLTAIGSTLNCSALSRISTNVTVGLNSTHFIFSPHTTTPICNSQTEGAVYYNGIIKKHYGCNSLAWNALY